MSRPCLVAATLLVSAGCASIPRGRGHQQVSAWLEDRAGAATGWAAGTPEDTAIQERVRQLLEGGLTRRGAMQIALLNNPSLQETYEGLNVSQADLLQAGLLSNPSLGMSVGFPLIESRLEYEASLVGSFLDLFVLPLRKRVAEEQFIADTLRVAHEAWQVVAEVSAEFVALQAAVQRVELNRAVVAAAASAAQLAQQQRAAGNVPELASARQQASYEQDRLRLAEAELELFEHREALHRALGLWGVRTDWTLAETLPELPADDETLESLEAQALRQRLDVDAARKQVLLLGNAVSLAKTSRVLGLVRVGVHIHQDPDGPRLLGPTLELELPVFDQRQAEIGRLEALQRQAERRLAALSVRARSEVRVAHGQMRLARERVEHHLRRLVPLRERVLQQSQLQYNAMQLGLFELLEAKREQVEADESYLRSLERFWTARVELERALGARFAREKTK